VHLHRPRPTGPARSRCSRRPARTSDATRAATETSLEDQRCLVGNDTITREGPDGRGWR
jgi:hypothetical protein